MILTVFTGRRKDRRILSKLEKLPRVKCIYSCDSDGPLRIWSTYWSGESQSVISKILPRCPLTTAILDLDELARVLFMQIFLAEIIAKSPNSSDAKNDFIAHCKLRFAGDEGKLKQLDEFECQYKGAEAVNCPRKKNHDETA